MQYLMIWAMIWGTMPITAAHVFLRETLHQTSTDHIPTFRVLIFWDTECPICQKTTRRVQEMADNYGPDVQFEAVYPTETTTLADVKEFEQAYGITLPHRLDPAHRLVKKYKATTTPEVILLSGQDKILYKGSVDDQFYKLGRYRPAPTAFYLKDAIDAARAGKSVTVRQTTPTGCLINRE